MRESHLVEQYWLRNIPDASSPQMDNKYRVPHPSPDLSNHDSKPVKQSKELPTPGTIAKILPSPALESKTPNKESSHKNMINHVEPEPRSPALRKAVGNYEIGDPIGKGVFSVVRTATHRKSGKEVAIKIVDRTRVTEKDLTTLVRKMQVMKLLSHPNTVNLYEIIDTPSAFFLVLELISGKTLHTHLKDTGALSEADSRHLFGQLVSAVHYCHSRHVVHRDIKLNNIMVTNDLTVKLIDFGLSRKFERQKLDTHCGTPVHTRPPLCPLQKIPLDGLRFSVFSLPNFDALIRLSGRICE